MNDESATKNRLINWAIADGALDAIGEMLPAGFLQSRVAGARCLIRPRTNHISRSLSDLQHPENMGNVTSVLACVADALNEREPRIKLTPDFGRYAGLADILYSYTPNVLGIRCEDGGCGGKSSYSTTGVVAAIKRVTGIMSSSEPVTCVGSAGAMGSGVLEYFRVGQVDDVVVCDLVYDAPHCVPVPHDCAHVQSQPGSFTAAALRRGGCIVATTVGEELENSPLDAIPAGTSLFLAHNLALPSGTAGIALARVLSRRGVLVIPGQVLTLGGALTARLEWYWRQQSSCRPFDKVLAHDVVTRLVSYTMDRILALAKCSEISPYEAMLELATDNTGALDTTGE
jgi:hypothetical protein